MFTRITPVRFLSEPSPDLAFRSSWGAALFFFVLCWTALASAGTGHAADAVDIAVDAFAIGGNAVGVPINEEEKAFVKPLVRCAVSGKDLGECAKEALIQTITERLPAEAQAFAQCISAGGSAATCASTEVIGRLPPEAQPLATCVVQGANVGDCAKQFATTQAESAAFSTLEKLKADGREKLSQTPSSIQNIINVVEGIRDDDWVKVTVNGGPEVYKVAATAVLNALLTPALSPIIGPIVDAVVQNRVDLFTALVGAIKANDAPKITEIVTEFYLTTYAEVPCALLLEGAFKESTCGTLGKVFKAVAGFGGQITQVSLGVGKDVLHWTGLPDLVDESGVGDFIDSATSGRLFTGKEKPEVCGSADKWYAENAFQCYHRGAYLEPDSDEFQEFLNDLNQRCRRNYIRCHTSKTVDRICPPLIDRFREHAQTVAAGLAEAAAIYVRTFGGYLEANAWMCTNDQDYETGADKFITDCEAALRKNIPLEGDPTSPSCGFEQQSIAGIRMSAHKAACLRALQENQPRQTLANFCISHPHPRDIRDSSMSRSPVNVLTRLEPTDPIVRRSIPTALTPIAPPPAICPAGWNGTYPMCCPPGTRRDNGKCEPATETQMSSATSLSPGSNFQNNTRATFARPKVDLPTSTGRPQRLSPDRSPTWQFGMPAHTWVSQVPRLRNPQIHFPIRTTPVPRPVTPVPSRPPSGGLSRQQSDFLDFGVVAKPRPSFPVK